jgi:RNA polymerase sigma-70 factor (ECF subfamily)
MATPTQPQASQTARAASHLPANLSGQEPEDAALISGAAVGFATACAALRGPAPAGDRLLDAILSLWRHAGSHQQTMSALRVWFLSIVPDSATDHGNSRLPLVPRPCDIDQDERNGRLDEDVVTTVLVSAEARRLWDALRTLPTAQREAVALAFFAELTGAQSTAWTALPLARSGAGYGSVCGGDAGIWLTSRRARLRDRTLPKTRFRGGIDPTPVVAPYDFSIRKWTHPNTDRSAGGCPSTTGQLTSVLGDASRDDAKGGYARPR